MDDTDLEVEIRLALMADADAFEFPDDLPQRTLAAARRAGATRMRTARRPWVYAAAVAAVVPVLFAIGRVAVNPNTAHASRTAPAPAGNGTVGGVDGSGLKTDTGAPPFAPAPILSGVPVPGPVPEPAAGPNTPGAPPALGAPVPGFQPSVVRTASVGIRVAKGQFPAAWAQATAAAGRHGGQVSDSNAHTVNGRLAQGTLDLRVPTDQLDAALADLQRLGTTTSLATSSQDVSGRIADADARLRALRAQEAEYLQLLPGARSTADVLAIRGALDSVRQEIETLQGSQAFLQTQVALALIQVTVSEPGTAVNPAVAVIQAQDRFSNAWQRAKDGAAAVLAGFIIAVGYLAAPALVAGVAWALVRRVRRQVV